MDSVATSSAPAAARCRTRSPTTAAPDEEASASDTMPSLGALPDDELLHVLSMLTPRELLGCRRVCRRWRDLALHPVLWGRIHLSWSGKGVFESAMRLAPCAAGYQFSWSKSDRAQVESPLLVETSCALGYLSVSCMWKGGCLAAALVIKRQASLGRLRRLGVFIDEEASACPGMHYLLQTVDNIAGLEELRIQFDASRLPPAVVLPLPAAGPPTAASLRTLTLRTAPWWPMCSSISSEPRLSLYLSRHATTLRDLAVDSDAPGLAAKLATMPGLSKLQCPMLAGMTALAASPSLRSLELLVDYDVADKPESPLSEAVAFLRATTGMLKEISLEYIDEDDVVEDPKDPQVVDLVLALRGRPGPVQSVLERLRIDYNRTGFAFEPPPQLRPLASILHRLPLLQRLEVNGVTTPPFLNAIDAKSVPLLRLLKVNRASDCSHAWLHSPEVQALRDRLPRLHFEIESTYCCEPFFDQEDKDNGRFCDLCEDLDCHPAIEGNSEHVLLFPHPEPDPCDLCDEKRAYRGGWGAAILMLPASDPDV